MRRTTTSAVTVLLAAGTLLTACGEGDASVPASVSASAPRTVTTPSPSSTAQLRLPLSAYMPSEKQSAQQRALEVILTRVCMRDMGFPPRSSTSLSEIIDMHVRTERHEHSRRYGISDRRVAATFGYRMPSFTDGPGKPISLNSLSEDELVAWQGPRPGQSSPVIGGKAVPEGGCRGEAGRTVGRGQAATRGLAAQLSQQSFQRLKGDPRIRDVHAEWARCMAELGYRYTSPWTSGTDFTRNEKGRPSRKPSKEEVKAALADVDCSYKTNVFGISFAVESEFQNAEIEKNAETLKKEKQQVAEQAARLQDLADRHGG